MSHRRSSRSMSGQVGVSRSPRVRTIVGLEGDGTSLTASYRFERSVGVNLPLVIWGSEANHPIAGRLNAWQIITYTTHPATLATRSDAGGWTRTSDPGLMNPLLYQLSYTGEFIVSSGHVLTIVVKCPLF